MNAASASGAAPARLALDAARAAGADYADVRIVRHRMQQIYARNERIHDLRDEESLGLAVRCLRQGAWGFAGTSQVGSDAVRSTARRAVEMARAAGVAATHPAVLAPETPHVASYATPRVKDPFAVSLEEKAALLLAANAEMRKVPEIRMALGMILHIQQSSLFLSSEGAEIVRDRLLTHGFLEATAVGNGDRQTRTYTISGRHAGWEHIEAADLLGNAPRVAEEAKLKLFAASGPVGPTDLVLDPGNLHLAIHESIGHATELDRVLGYEADYAGTSFATPEKLGRFRYGSKLVNVVADNTTPEFLASLGFDDEGVEAQRWDVIRDGILVGYSTSREVAPRIGETRSRGSCRAFGWWNAPIVRIPNLGIMPHQGTPEELIADTRDGIYIQGSGTFSIDQQRMCFQFGGDLFWRIENGKLTTPLKNVIYRSTTPAFWNACDAVCGPEDWRPIGIINCGKGQPGQPGQMTHYAATARFHAIEVDRGGE